MFLEKVEAREPVRLHLVGQVRLLLEIDQDEPVFAPVMHPDFFEREIVVFMVEMSRRQICYDFCVQT